jgi:uroporphyrinogen decarboxylase
MYRDPEAWHALMARLADAVAEFLVAQVAAGAQAVQLFDSWVGALSPDDYAEYAYPYTERIFAALADSGVPRIHFGTGATTLLPMMANAGCDVIGLDWRVHLDEGWECAGYEKVVQGNLDPVVLFAPEHEIERRVLDIVKRADGRPGHIFNLGHGILPETPPEAVGFVTDLVHRVTRRDG